MNKFLLIITLLFTFATFIVLWITQGDNSSGNGNEMATAIESGDSYGDEQGAAAIGGAFTLTDQYGRVRTDLDFRGRTMLVFFGFTNCPDICPVTVATLSSLMELLGDKASQVAPVFITVDPKRDTPQVMKDYLKNFDNRIVALTGSPDVIKEVTNTYKVYYSMRSDDDDEEEAGDTGYGSSTDHSAHAGHGGGSSYQVDHSGYIYVMDKEGRYVKHFPYNVSEQELADELKPFLK